MLGMFVQTGIIKLLTTNTPLRIRLGGKLVAIEGREYSDTIDDNPKNYEPLVPADFNILINHGMLVPNNFISKHTLIDDVMQPADITIGGHYHPGFKDYTSKNGGKFYNPGSLLRVEASVVNKTFRPKVMLFDIVNEAGNIVYTKRIFISRQLFLEIRYLILLLFNSRSKAMIY
jgi:predicted phosphodiesterase